MLSRWSDLYQTSWAQFDFEWQWHTTVPTVYPTALWAISFRYEGKKQKS